MEKYIATLTMQVKVEVYGNDHEDAVSAAGEFSEELGDAILNISEDIESVDCDEIAVKNEPEIE